VRLLDDGDQGRTAAASAASGMSLEGAQLLARSVNFGQYLRKVVEQIAAHSNERTYGCNMRYCQ